MDYHFTMPLVLVRLFIFYSHKYCKYIFYHNRTSMRVKTNCNFQFILEK